MGRWIEEDKHECDYPRTKAELGDGAEGAIWQCVCGRRFKLLAILEVPGVHIKPYLQWLRLEPSRNPFVV